MKKINVAELLKDCPKGMELDCTMYNDVKFIGVEEYNKPICIRTGDIYRYLTKYGTWSFDESAKCVIFPKGKTTWEGFQRPFNPGDIVITDNNEHAFIYSGENYNFWEAYCGVYCNTRNICINSKQWSNKTHNIRLATEKEKEELFQVIKDNGYKWNAETKTLEKLPKFKVGDRIILKDNPHNIPSIKIKAVTKSQYILESEGFFYIDSADEKYVLENKFDITTLKPFESKVLVRHNRDNKWCGSFFSHIDEDFHSHCYKFVTTAGKSYPMCIPYEDNQHLLGKTHDCDEYYKSWK